MKIAKYVIVGLLFVVWIVFFDVHNVKEEMKYRIKISNLEDEKVYFLEKIKEDSIRLHELNTSDKNLEKFAREKYHMKKEGEQIFLIKKED